MSRPNPTEGPPEVRVILHGTLPPSEVDRAVEAVEAVARHAPRPVIAAECDLRVHGDPARERRFEARAMLDVSGRIVRARVAAEDMGLAIDRMQARMRRRLADLAEGRRAARHHPGEAAGGEWRHGDLPAERQDYFPRPPEEREVLRRATYDAGPMTTDEAAWELHMLDERFHLFTDAATGGDAVLSVLDDGTLQLLQAVPDPDAESRAAVALRAVATPAPVMTLDSARTLLDAEDVSFVFYVADDGRGRVLYRRNDGHYGLVEPTSA